MPIEFAISALVTLLVVVDPVGLAPTFLAVTDGLSAQHRRQVALRASLIAAAILIGAALVGDWLLRTLGISLPAFRIAGGLLLFSIAFEMVFGFRIERQSRRPNRRSRSTCATSPPSRWQFRCWPGPARSPRPCCWPDRPRPPGRAGGLVGVIVLVAASAWVTFLVAERIGKLLGITGNIVLSRLLGVILAALAVQYVIDGVRAVFAA